MFILCCVSSKEDGSFVKSIPDVLWLLSSVDFFEPNALPNASTAYQAPSSSGFLLVALSASSSSLLLRFNEDNIMVVWEETVRLTILLLNSGGENDLH